MRPWIVITPDSGRQQRNMQRSVSLGMESNGAHIASTFENFQENVYHFIKILGSGAFGETVLYRKTKVNVCVKISFQNGQKRCENKLDFYVALLVG